MMEMDKGQGLGSGLWGNLKRKGVDLDDKVKRKWGGNGTMMLNVEFRST